jgi:hypothetical protein
MKMHEVFSISDFPEHNIDYDKLSNDLISNPDDIVKVQDDLSIYVSKEWHTLVKNDNALGFIKLSKQSIKNITYNHIDMIYIFPKYRNTKAIYWLLFYVKEHVDRPIIADGAIFKNGQSLIKKISTNNLLRLSILDKTTGNKLPFTHLVNDPDLCYIFESTNLGTGRQYFPESFTYFPLFDVI